MSLDHADFGTLSSLSNGTLDALDRALADSPDPEPRFTKWQEEALVSLAFDFPDFFKEVTPWLRPGMFGGEATRGIIELLLDALKTEDVIPTREWVRDRVERVLTEDDPYEDWFRCLDRKSDPREVPIIKKEMIEWAKERHHKMHEDAIVEALTSRNYAIAKEIISKCERVGVAEEASFGFTDVNDFLAEDLSFDYYIESVMVAGQPFLVGGKKKCLKTAILCDMVASLASATPFLGKFRVSKARRVGFFSAESGKHDIQHRLKTILTAKHATIAKGHLFLSFERPRLSDDDVLASISAFVKKHALEVLVVDPLYLTLLTGNAEATGSDLYSMGGVLAKVADACISCGATAVLAHHFKKSASDHLDLDDFSFTGAAEFARQSLLIGRRGEYTGPRNNQMRIRTHGYGRGEVFAAHIDEGDLDDPKWAITITEEQDLREAVANTEQGKLLAALMEHGPTTKRGLATRLRWNGTKVREALGRAEAAGLVEQDEEGLWKAAEEGRDA